MNNIELKNELETQLEFVQKKISEITGYKSSFIDIKQISDLQRYIEMQRNIIESLHVVKRVI